jgi:NAD(P)-dependent dehydrogenase (short-subunit alcohol dehydrogenase family)
LAQIFGETLLNVINIMSSIGGIQGGGGNAIYSTTKGAVRLMIYGLAQELGSKGIRVNTIHWTSLKRL